MREALRPYLSTCFAEYSRTGDPVMAPIFYHFEGEADVHGDATRYMLGPDLLVAPVLQPGIRQMSVALPSGAIWRHVWTGETFVGGTVADVACEWGQCPVFARESSVEKFKDAFPALGRTG